MFAKLIWVKRVENPREKKTFSAVWHKIWLEERYATPEESIVEKYSKYDPVSTDFLAKLLGVIPVGTIRVIRNSSLGLPVFNDFEIEKNSEGKVVELTLFAVIKNCRNTLVPLILMRAAYRYAKNEKNDGMVIAADRRLYFLLTKRFGFPFHQIGPAKMYEGSVTYPAYLNFEEADKVMSEKNPLLHRFFTK